MASISKAIAFMRTACNDWSLGYDQSNRWDVRDGGETDCSALVITALRDAGFDTGSASYTGDMSDNLCARGWVRLTNDGNPQPGDILLNDSHHVAMYVGDGDLCQASSGEPGHGVSGGQSGDQTGYETNEKAYYNFPWSCYLRYTGEDDGDDDMSVFTDAHKNDSIANDSGADPRTRLEYVDEYTGDLWRQLVNPHDNVCNGQKQVFTKDQIDYIDQRVLEIDSKVDAILKAVTAK